MTFSSLKTSEVIARAILKDICVNNLEQGDPLLMEAAMVEKYQAGRASVREALRLLETQGLVTLKPGRSGGAFVRGADSDHVGRMLTLFLQMMGATYNEVTMASLVIGPKVAEMAALNPDRELVERELARALATDRCHFTVSPEIDPEELLDFHHAVNSLCGNPVLGLLMDTLESIMVNHIIHLVPSEDRRPWIFSDHERLAEAIIAGDGQQARDRYKAHLQSSIDYYREHNHGKFTEMVQWQ